MPKITINAILTVLRLVMSLVTKCIRLVYGIIDLTDDGCLNNSVPRPDWMQVLVSAINTLESLGGELSSVEDSIYQDSVK